uniref:PAZ domain-containing protein n=2 Tax=Meloidogyne enterolobii TaxID=390850 RepID=A0A6V7Y9C4_MELEN|nr:unnamed protein product [Meloidogyne enterolobii]
MPYQKVSDECASILNCSVKSLRDQLNHPDNRVLILKELLGRKVQTTYEDKNGFKKIFVIGGLSRQGATSLKSYGKLRFPFNVSVAAHFYARHRIRLRYPFLHCIIERFRHRRQDRFYPMELLELIDDKEDQKDNTNDWMEQLYSDMSTKCNIFDEQEKTDEDMYCYSGDLSQW